MQGSSGYSAPSYYPPPQQQYVVPPSFPDPTPNPHAPAANYAPPAPITSNYASAPPYSVYPAAAPAPAPAPAPAADVPAGYFNYAQPQPQPPIAPAPAPAPFYPYEAQQPAVNYAAPVNPPVGSNQPITASSYYPYEAPPATSEYANPANPVAAAANPSYAPQYTGYDTAYQPGQYYGENSVNYGTAASGYQDFYGAKPEGELRYDQGGFDEEGLNDGAYAYDGGALEPYGARGTVPTRLSTVDDYGRSSFSSGSNGRTGGSMKVVKAVPKADDTGDVKSGVQKFRVKLLAEGVESNLDVLCQIGLDGINMLDPNTYRTLRTYPLDSLTRWEVLDSTIFAFWSKSSDAELKRTRLKSNSYTTNTILDTVTAATVQFKEIGGSRLMRSKSASDAGKSSENEKKKGFEWLNFAKPAEELKDHWIPDGNVKQCASCGIEFSPFNRRHHCRNCGEIFCDKCSQGRIALTADEDAQPVRVCDRCMAIVTERLSNAREAANKPVVQSHEDIAKKLKEEMDKNRRSSGASSGTRMREVACPICTVHLQVQVPSYGSETVECGVCQNKFLVGAD